MSTPKERHYWGQLRAALTAGQWRAPNPAKAYNGAAISWSELFRKFNKHCKGYQDVVEVASQTHALALLLSAPYPDEDEDADFVEPESSGDGAGEDGTATPRLGKLDVRGESELPDNRIDEAKTGYETLKSLDSSSTFDTIKLALAYYAYALGNPSECIDYLAKIPELLQFLNHIPTLGSTRSSTSHGLLAPSTYAPSTTSFSGSFTSIVDTTVPEVRDGRGWAMAETFRALCLQGMSHERLSPSTPEKALEAYAISLPLFSSLQSEFSHNALPKSSGKFDFTVFQQLREVWRWVERLLWRAVILSSRTSNIHADSERASLDLWIWLGHYNSCSEYWPPSFRTAHRSTISTIHLRALILRNGALSPLPLTYCSRKFDSPSSTNTVTPATASTNQLPLLTSSTTWLHAARSAIQDYRAVLTASTKFPRAGRRNVKVEEFVDLCVAVWEVGGAYGEQAGWVIDILWWATRLTFNSSRILRHITRLLHLGGDTALAKRTLRLYIQVVGKAYQASQEGVGEDKDTDEYWVDTLVFGARMLCKSAAALPGLEGIDDVKEAGTVLEKARTRLDSENKVLVAKILLAEGIYWNMLAVKGQEPLDRSAQLEKAHVALQQSLLAHSTPPAYYHLALSYAHRGGPVHDLERAIECAGHAVEGEPKEVRYWHLLGLLLTAAEKWDEAKEILEHGAELDVEEEAAPEAATNGNGEAASVQDDNGTSTTTVTQNGDTMTLKVPEVEGTVQSNKVPVSASLNANGLTNGALKLKPKLNGSSEPFLPNTAGASLSSSSSPIESTIPIPVLDPDACELPLADHLLRRSELTFEQYPPSKAELFERHLQLRMTQVGLMEVFEGAEGAEQGWLDVFAWVADKRGAAATADGASGASQPRQSLDGLRRSIDRLSADPAGIEKTTSPTYPGLPNSSSETGPRQSLTVPPPIPIMISPATPDAEKMDVPPPPVPTADSMLEREKEDKKERDVRKERKASSGLHPKSKRSSSIERDRGDTSKSKKVGQMLKNRVDKGRAGITAVSRKIGHGVVKNGPLRRSSSTPDFAVVFQQTSYQASSIHSRRRLSSIIHSQDRTPNDSPPPPPPPPPPSVPPSTNEQDFKFRNKRSSRENRLLSDLWLMSAATFRRLGKIEQAKGSIQEAEVKDENNPNVWVQLGLYYVALGHYRHAIDTFQKALFISSEEVSATVHLSRLYLDPDISAQLRIPPNATTSSSASSVNSNSDDFSSYPDVDLAAGILAHLTKGRGWDVPEAWYFLAKAYGLQGRKAEERETLKLALELSEKRAVRDIGLALGWCI